MALDKSARTTLTRISTVKPVLIACPLFCDLVKITGRKYMDGSVKEPNISIYLFFRPSLSGVLFLILYLLLEWECQILVFKNITS